MTPVSPAVLAVHVMHLFYTQTCTQKTNVISLTAFPVLTQLCFGYSCDYSDWNSFYPTPHSLTIPHLNSLSCLGQTLKGRPFYYMSKIIFCEDDFLVSISVSLNQISVKGVVLLLNFYAKTFSIFKCIQLVNQVLSLVMRIVLNIRYFSITLKVLQNSVMPVDI